MRPVRVTRDPADVRSLKEAPLEHRRTRVESCEIALGASDLVDAEARTADLLLSYPSLRHALYRALECCQSFRTTAEVEEAVTPLVPGASVYSVVTLLDWLHRAGALERPVLGDAADQYSPVEATASAPAVGALSTSDAVPQVARLWQTTPAGIAVLERFAPSRLLRELQETEDVRYLHIYPIVLAFCDEEPRSTKEIDTLLVDHPDLQNPRRYASYFINKLGEVGAIEWNGKWSTTEIGRSAIQA